MSLTRPYTVIHFLLEPAWVRPCLPMSCIPESGERHVLSHSLRDWPLKMMLCCSNLVLNVCILYTCCQRGSSSSWLVLVLVHPQLTPLTTLVEVFILSLLLVTAVGMIKERRRSSLFMLILPLPHPLPLYMFTCWLVPAVVDAVNTWEAGDADADVVAIAAAVAAVACDAIAVACDAIAIACVAIADAVAICERSSCRCSCRCCWWCCCWCYFNNCDAVNCDAMLLLLMLVLLLMPLA